VGLDFEWDEKKARANKKKHGVSFDEAATVFGDPLALTIPDPEHSEDEEHFITMGNSAAGRLLVVVAVDRDDKTRIISARPASRRERKDYEEVN
jgi:uncharacterized protein